MRRHAMAAASRTLRAAPRRDAAARPRAGSATTSTLVAPRSRVPRGRPVRRDGAACPRWVGIEYMAQAVAAWAGLRAPQRRRDAAASASCWARRRYEAQRAGLRSGRRLRVEVRCELMRRQRPGPCSTAASTIGRRRLATARASTVFEPPERRRTSCRTGTHEHERDGAGHRLQPRHRPRHRPAPGARTATTSWCIAAAGRDEADAVAARDRGAGRARRACCSSTSPTAPPAAAALEADIAAHGAYYGVVCNAGIARDNAFPAMTRRGVGRRRPHQPRRLLQRAQPLVDADGPAPQAGAHRHARLGLRR